MVTFRNREDAARQLAAVLAEKGVEAPVVLGIPRGGVPIAAGVARALHGELGVVVARKLGAPVQPELAIGAVTADGVAWVNEELAREVGADDRYLAAEKERQVDEARRREEAFDEHVRPSLAGRTVIVTDDGIATGATARAALRSVREAGAERVILAVPVGPPDTIAEMREEADDVVCVHTVAEFFAIGQFYVDFSPTTDDEVKRLLAEARERTASR